MKTWHVIITAAVLSAVLSGIGWPIENPSIRNPADLSTIPPSSLRNGLYRSPNATDIGGNLLITGNTRGGTYFRGPVPYRSSTSFGAPLGSTSFDSFLRDSAGAEDSRRYGGRYTPYYSLTGTVSKIMPGQSGIYTPASPRVGGNAGEPYGLEARPRGQASAVQQTSTLGRGLWTMPLTAQDMDRLIKSDLQKPSGYNSRFADEQYKSEIELLRRELQSLEGEQSKTWQSPTQKDEPLGALQKVETSESEKRPSEPPTTAKQKTQAVSPQEKTLLATPESSDVLEQIKARLESLQKGTVEQPHVGRTGETPEEEGGKEQEKPYFEAFSVINTEASSQKQTYKQAQSGATTADMDQEQAIVSEQASPVDEINKLSDADLKVRARRIMGPYKDLASFSEARFNQHLAAADTYLREGTYYRASDYYGLASIYRPSDARPYAGKSHALLAAGEYVSSALFLLRALEASAEYARSKVDLAAALGTDKLESRVVDLKQWLAKSKAPELEFLLGYVYYRIGRLQEAKGAIDAASERMPTSAAVAALKNAVEEAIEAAKSK